ncbi:unnamed protein product [Spirodela intermedia]|uniref:Uncharacterized protein n=1 Tax=Spirodela intermedia TaxID=51605 RepID=A0A7I8JQP7_SPIIN|nr:unnamed protein product [Spirodela intermedia]CAA6672499.1 unnamed protein product [Spirodela intermedia]
MSKKNFRSHRHYMTIISNTQNFDVLSIHYSHDVGTLFYYFLITLTFIIIF